MIINSLTNKFDTLTQQITGNIDVLMLSETKLDSFPEGQFLIAGFEATYGEDPNCHEGFFVRENIPSKLKTFTLEMVTLWLL